VKEELNLLATFVLAKEEGLVDIYMVIPIFLLPRCSLLCDLCFVPRGRNMLCSFNVRVDCERKEWTCCRRLIPIPSNDRSISLPSVAGLASIHTWFCNWTEGTSSIVEEVAASNIVP
jgi:hypothetical protein